MAVYLEDNFDENPKVQLLPDERAAWLYVRGLLYCQRNPKSRGRIPKRAVPELTKLPRPKTLAAMLATDHGAGVLWEDDGAFYAVHDWGIHNQRAIERSDELDAQQQARRDRAAKAAAARWSGQKDASSEHGLSIAQASAEHGPSNAQASDPGCSEHASRVRGRAPDPSPSPNAQSPAQDMPVGMLDASSADAGADARAMRLEGAEKETSKGSNPQVSPAVRGRWEELFPRRRREALTVLGDLLEHFDETFLDEAIGHCVARETPPTSPRYLVTIALDWSRQRGIYPEGHPVYATLGKGAA